MVRVKAKKAKGDEAFENRKQKVGRKKLAPVTVTKTEVHARTLRITAPHQSLGAASAPNQPKDHVGEKEEKRPPRTFREELNGAMHYRAPTRRGAFLALAKIVKGESRNVDPVSPVQMLQLLTVSLEAMCDNEKEVREGVDAAVTALVSIPNSIAGPSLTIVVRNLLIVLTHANRGVRRTGMTFMGELLSRQKGALIRYTLDNVESSSAADVQARIEDIRTLVRHSATIAKQRGFLRELSLLVEETRQDPSVLTPAFAEELYEECIDYFATTWKECNELRGSLFRNHPEHLQKAVAIADLIATLLDKMQEQQGLLTRQRVRRVKDLVTTQVLFSNDELATSPSGDARDFGMSLARSQATLASTVPECFAAAKTYLSTSLESSKHRNFRPSLALLRKLAGSEEVCISSIPLFRTAMGAVRTCLAENPAPGLLDDAVSTMKSFFAICPTTEYADKLRPEFELIPRMLFSSRKLDLVSRQSFIGGLLEVLWNTLSQIHPVVTGVNMGHFALGLSSIFGVPSASGEMIDVTLAGLTEATRRLATELFAFIPAASLPPTLPESVKTFLADVNA